MEKLIASLIEGRAIDTASLKQCFDQFCAGQPYPPEQLAALLVLLRARGATPEQLAVFADVACAKAVPIDVPPGAVSFVGTGGDHGGAVTMTVPLKQSHVCCGRLSI